MCDERTLREEALYLSRRGVARLGAGMLASASLGACAPSATVAGPAANSLRHSTVSFPTDDGTMDAFFVHPERGRHPAVLIWPDIAGPRPAFEQMATRLAGAGFAVLLANQYYRSAPAPHFQTNPEWRTPEGRARVARMVERISPSGIARDALAAIHWLDSQPAVDARRGAAVTGYCMGGPFAVRSAAVSDRFRAVASFHGSNLVTDAADSPHRLFPALRAAMLFAIAQNDDAEAPSDKDSLRAAASAAGREAEIEVYPAQHGWCTLDHPVYDAVQAERAWGRMLALFFAQL